jgi:hypothetical protein
MRSSILLVLFLVLFKSGAVLAQAQNCVGDAAWPSSYVAKDSIGSGGSITTVTFQPPISADVGVASASVEQGRLSLTLSMIDNCSGLGPRTTKEISVPLRSIAPAQYNFAVLVETQNFGGVIEIYPEVVLSNISIGGYRSIPVINQWPSILVASIAMLSLGLFFVEKRYFMYK